MIYHVALKMEGSQATSREHISNIIRRIGHTVPGNQTAMVIYFQRLHVASDTRLPL